MGRYLGFITSAASGLLEYETQKVVQIHSKKIGITFRLIQLGIILYVILWVMVYEKGYQSFDQAVSGVTAKLKGIAFANVTNNTAIGASVWDAADYVIPPQQNSAFFVMTNLVSTPGQTLSSCEEAHDVYGNSCKSNEDCTAGKLVMTGSGIQTGRCVNSTRQKDLKVCEIYGWCPTEYDITPRPHLLKSAENFTVILKNSIEFPRYRVKRRNILKWMDKLFLKTCRYNPSDDKLKYCPIFRLGDILKFSGAHNKDIWENGGMISIHIEWNCNLDFNENKCLPKYVFRRLDDFESSIAKGWNFRFSHHYIENGIRKRNLIKAYGIQFFITVYGTGGKFNILTFSMNLGSGLALLGIATVLCDMIILNTTRKRSMYRRAKIDLVAQKQRLECAQAQLSLKYKNAHEKNMENSNGQKIIPNITDTTVNSTINPTDNTIAKINKQTTTINNDDNNTTVSSFLTSQVPQLPSSVLPTASSNSKNSEFGITNLSKFKSNKYHITKQQTEPVIHHLWFDKSCNKQYNKERSQMGFIDLNRFPINQPSFLGVHPSASANLNPYNLNTTNKNNSSNEKNLKLLSRSTSQNNNIYSTKSKLNDTEMVINIRCNSHQNLSDNLSKKRGDNLTNIVPFGPPKILHKNSHFK